MWCHCLGRLHILSGHYTFFHKSRSQQVLSVSLLHKNKLQISIIPPLTIFALQESSYTSHTLRTLYSSKILAFPLLIPVISVCIIYLYSSKIEAATSASEHCSCETQTSTHLELFIFFPTHTTAPVIWSLCFTPFYSTCKSFLTTEVNPHISYFFSFLTNTSLSSARIEHSLTIDWKHSYCT